MELNKIYLGDAYELIKQIPDKSIDLIVTDPPYEFVPSGSGHSDLGQQKRTNANDIFNLDTNRTKQNIVTGGGCFGTKQRDYYSEFSETDVSKQRQEYLDYVAEHGKDDYSETLRINIGMKPVRESIRFISQGITNDILKEFVRVMKKGNIYIFCNKNQLRQYFDFFGDLGWNLDLLVWNKTNCIPKINNTYLANLEYCVFARESGVPLYGSYETKSKCYTSSCNKKDKDLYLHPTIKPLQFIKNLIINSSQENQVVLDPFMGSGTTAVACKELNRQFIGFELNPKFYEIANDRLNDVTQVDKKKEEQGYMKLF